MSCRNVLTKRRMPYALNNGLDHVAIDSFMKVLIRGLILLVALIIDVYAQRLHERVPNGG